MKSKKVIILLSSYNGEKYIEEQLNSIFAQDYSNFELLVRDDGSTDETIKILKKFQTCNDNMHVEYGKNIGFFKSFLWLLKNANIADYYAFCDQDDYWDVNKISYAVEKMSLQNKNIPILYFTNYLICDKNLNSLEFSKNINDPSHLERALIANQCPLGFNTVINYNLKKYIDNLDLRDLNIWGHDYWCYLIALSFGKVIYDTRSSAKYRRHEKNVSKYEKRFISRQILRIKKFIIDDDYSPIKKTVELFYKKYSNDMDSKTKETFQLFATRNLISNFKKALYYKKYSDSNFDEIAIRFLLLIGKL